LFLHNTDPITHFRPPGVVFSHLAAAKAAIGCRVHRFQYFDVPQAETGASRSGIRFARMGLLEAGPTADPADDMSF
jgi:hypothetical protein